MWFKLLIGIICVALFTKVKDFLSYLRTYSRLARVAKRFPHHEDSHWFWGLTHVTKDYKDYIDICQKYMEKTRHRLFITWLMFIRPGFLIVHPEPYKTIVTTSHMSLPKDITWAGAYRFLKPWIGDGLLVSGGKKWERNRRLLTPALHFNVLKPYVSIYHDVADILVRKLAALGTGESSLNICPLISRATLDTMLRCTLSYKSEGIQSTGGEQHPYVFAVEKLKSLLMKRAMNPLIYNDFIYSWTADCREYKHYCSFVHTFSNDIIQYRKKALREDPAQLDKRHLDFLDILITAKDENGMGLTDQEIRDEVDTFMFAGHDTTASSIMWTLYSLAKYPDMQENVRKDIQDVLQDRTRLEVDDLPKLNYTTRFIKESMRMYTPVPAITRKLAEPVTVEGVTFPAGSVIDLHPHLMHHNPSVWEDHAIFDPDRFTPENIAKKDPFAFLPFSAGQRNCIGQHFAMNEIKTLVSRVVTRFQIMCNEAREAIPYPEVIMSAKDGIYLQFREL